MSEERAYACCQHSTEKLAASIEARPALMDLMKGGT